MASRIAALIFAACFFAWKIFAGWLILNLDIFIEVERQRKDDTTDWLAIKLLLKKGNTDALWLKDIAIEIHQAENEKPVSILRIHEFRAFRMDDKNEISWIKPGKNSRKFTIAPGETFQFGRVLEVPVGVPLIVEAAVFGKRTLHFKGFQWRASKACLPVKSMNGV